MKCDELKAEQWLDYSGEPMPCYPKAKVDEAIEELKQKLENVQASMYCDVVDANMENLKLNRKLRHQKYKRCLAMAQEWRNYAAFCGMQSSCHNHRGFGKTAEKYSWKECHDWKCVHRYKELAEKFKEAK